tara:strand:+ start:2019 stop:2369 length:351 start_codon:yes stop_codon:yes gene_type:complete
MTNIPKSLTVHNLHDWLNSKNENPTIIDVRESLEIEIASLPFVDIYIPISKVSIKYVSSIISKQLNKNFVILCHRGIRSYNFAQWLLENELVKEVWNLEEGIDGWSIHIDSSIPRY